MVLSPFNQIEKSGPPIFIVGAPRSGTTLLAALLASHSRLSCGPETHFFRFLHKLASPDLLSKATWPHLAVDYLFAITQPGGPVPDNFGLTRAELTKYLAAREPAISAVLASLTELHTARDSKQRWIEKTPDHLLHVQEIRRIFPDAYMIRIVRDPRDVALSWTATWNHRSFLETLARLRHCDDRSYRFFETDRLSCTVRYEDLVTSPAEQLKRLCDFVRVDFESAMLDTRNAIKQVNATHEPWKEKAGTRIDPSRAGVWRRLLSPAEKKRAEAVLGDRLRAYGYAADDTFHGYAQIRPATSGLLRFKELRPVIEGVIPPLADSGFRLWPNRPSEKPTVVVYVGDPSAHWLGYDRWRRCRNTLRYAREVVAAKCGTAAVFWVDHHGVAPRQFGRCGSLLAWLLRRHRTDRLPDTLLHAEGLREASAATRSGPALH